MPKAINSFRDLINNCVENYIDKLDFDDLIEMADHFKLPHIESKWSIDKWEECEDKLRLDLAGKILLRLDL